MGDDFDYLIAHAMSCTLEKDNVYAMGYEGLGFASLHGRGDQESGKGVH